MWQQLRNLGLWYRAWKLTTLPCNYWNWSLYLDVQKWWRVWQMMIWFDLIWITPDGFTTVVANEGLEKARAYLNQVPQDRRLYIPSEGCGVNFRWEHLQTTPTHFFGIELSRLQDEKIPVAIVGLEPGTPRSAVQRFNAYNKGLNGRLHGHGLKWSVCTPNLRPLELISLVGQIFSGERNICSLRTSFWGMEEFKNFI